MQKKDATAIEAEQSFSVIEIGRVGKGDKNKWGPGMRDCYMLHFCLSGKGIFNGKSVSRGQYFIATPFSRVYYYPDKIQPWQYVWINFKGKDAQKTLSSYGFLTTTGISQFTITKEFEDTINLIFNDNFFMQSLSNESLTNFVKVLFSLNVYNKDITQKRKDIKREHFKKAVEYIKTMYHSSISPNDVAKYVKLDEKYLCSLFKKFAGTSIQNFLIDFRIEKSKTLLELSDMKINEISYSVGIEEPLYFSKVFKKHVGVSPKTYREQKQK